jgi:hypothetical protein
MYFYE